MGKHRRAARPAETVDDVTMPVHSVVEDRTPIYARMLGLRHIAPGAVACFLFFEGAIGLAVVLGLTGLVSWWGIAVIPIAVALAVKLNDIVAARMSHSRAHQKT